ncbi:MAG: hypothetical protein AMS14_02885, partial [Planctomycetes bacterium DG_20]
MYTSVFISLLLLGGTMGAEGKTLRLESRSMTVEVDAKTGQWALVDKRSGVRWPSKAAAGPGA